MSLRLRLILSQAALIAVLGLAAWWGVQRLTADLTAALGDTAVSVGRSMITVLRTGDGGLDHLPAMPPAADGDAPRPRALHIERRVAAGGEGVTLDKVRVTVDGRELTPDELAAADVAQHLAGAETVDVRVRNLQGEPTMLAVRGGGIERLIPLPDNGVDAAIERFTRQLGLGLLVLFGFGLVLSVWIAQRIAQPLRALAQSAQSLGRGALGTQAREHGAPEVRATIAAFNRMSAQLQQLDAEAASLRADRELAELGDIGRGLAHSLRNPLHALGLSLEALAAQAADPVRAAALASSGREQLQRVDQALRGFLALSAGGGADAEPVALRDVIDDVVLEATQRAQGRVAFVREGHATLSAVPAELRVVVHALVVNALDASPDGGCVVVRVAQDGDDASIDVIDEGEGISPAIRARLFQPHVSSKPHGAGMGLYLAQRLAMLRYGGGIAFDDAPTRGTIARLRLRPRAAHTAASTDLHE